MLDIVTIGHSTLDTLVKIAEAHLQCRLDQEKCELCLDYGDKVLAESVVASPGGNALNTGVGLARLGLRAGIVTLYGTNIAGEKIRQALSQEGLIEVGSCQNPQGQTDQSVILNYQSERTILAYHHPFVYKFPQDFPQTKWAYLTSINENFKSFHEEFLAWYKAIRGTVPLIAFNPGSHELRAGAANNSEILQVCQVLILNKEEAEDWLRPARTLPDSGVLLSGLHELGSKIVIITDAQNGSFAHDGEKFYHQAAYPCEVVEMTGAGDAFSTGLLAALIRGEDLPTALKWGTAEAASVIGQAGATPGLLTLDELGRMVSKLEAGR